MRFVGFAGGVFTAAVEASKFRTRFGPQEVLDEHERRSASSEGGSKSKRPLPIRLMAAHAAVNSALAGVAFFCSSFFYPCIVRLKV